MARPARPEQTKSARSSRQLSRFCYLINPDKVFGTHKDGQNETEQPDHSASLVDSITSSTRIRFSVHTAGNWDCRLELPAGQMRCDRACRRGERARQPAGLCLQVTRCCRQGPRPTAAAWPSAEVERRDDPLGI